MATLHVSFPLFNYSVYRKWNERFFLENYDAYIAGRLPNNPADNWYKGELGFFDFYIVSLFFCFSLIISPFVRH